MRYPSCAGDKDRRLRKDVNDVTDRYLWRSNLRRHQFPDCGLVSLQHSFLTNWQDATSAAIAMDDFWIRLGI